jgi:hypothetical protein
VYIIHFTHFGGVKPTKFVPWYVTSGWPLILSFYLRDHLKMYVIPKRRNCLVSLRAPPHQKDVRNNDLSYEFDGQHCIKEDIFVFSL